MSIARAQILPSWWYHMHKREEEAKGCLTHLVAPDNDSHNKQKVKWNKPRYLYSSINFQSQHRTWSVLCVSSPCWLLSPQKNPTYLFYSIKPSVVKKLHYLNIWPARQQSWHDTLKAVLTNLCLRWIAVHSPCKMFGWTHQKLPRWKNTRLEHWLAISLEKVSISLCCKRKTL